MRHDPEYANAPAGDIDIRLDDALKYALAIGAVLVLLLPGARGFSESLGWLPLWLLGMPAVALWAVRGFPVPRGADDIVPATARRRRSGPQARRRIRGQAQRRLSRAA